PQRRRPPGAALGATGGGGAGGGGGGGPAHSHTAALRGNQSSEFCGAEPGRCSTTLIPGNRRAPVLGLPPGSATSEAQRALLRRQQAESAESTASSKAAHAAYEAICEHLGERPWSRMPPPRSTMSTPIRGRGRDLAESVVANTQHLDRLIAE
ncbi:unnamed protein product, partial [Effrenium voratum]